MREQLSEARLADIIDQGRGKTPADLVIKSVGIFDLTSGEIATGDIAIAGDCIVGTPEACIETAKRYEAAGCDLLLCLMNPYKVPHRAVMESIELMGKYVIPALKK